MKTTPEEDKIIARIEERMLPYSITLTGREAIALVGTIVMHRGGEQGLALLTEYIALQIKAGDSVEEAINKAIGLVAQAGKPLPAYFAGLWTHCIKTTLEVKDEIEAGRT